MPRTTKVAGKSPAHDWHESNSLTPIVTDDILLSTQLSCVSALTEQYKQQKGGNRKNKRNKVFMQLSNAMTMCWRRDGRNLHKEQIKTKRLTYIPETKYNQNYTKSDVVRADTFWRIKPFRTDNQNQREAQWPTQEKMSNLENRIECFDVNIVYSCQQCRSTLLHRIPAQQYWSILLISSREQCG